MQDFEKNNFKANRARHGEQIIYATFNIVTVIFHLNANFLKIGNGNDYLFIIHLHLLVYLNGFLYIINA